MVLGADLLRKFGGGILHNINQHYLLLFETTSIRAIIHKENRWKLKMDIWIG